MFWFCLLGPLWLNFWAVCCAIRWCNVFFVSLLHRSCAYRSVGRDGRRSSGCKRGLNFSCSWGFRLICLFITGGIRFGEALHPGPGSSDEWCLGTFNPTGLTSKADVVSCLKGDVWGVTETHLSYEGCRKFRHGLKCNSSRYLYCVPGGLGSGPRRWGLFQVWPASANGLFVLCRTALTRYCSTPPEHRFMGFASIIFGLPWVWFMVFPIVFPINIPNITRSFFWNK